jgi:hypothetical protein
MADHHQVVDQIRAFAQSSDQTLTPQLEELAREYAEVCVAVNLRLGRCQRLLQQGLRSEAIQLAESEPKLLDSVAALDFPERGEWNDIAALYNFPAAPPIAVEAAQFLNEAYALEDPLQDLLRTHRRLALLRAPLVDRIAVLRKLAAQDSANPIWSDDQKTFEKVRFRQVQAEAADATRRQDVGGVGRLLAELEHSLWVEPPPPSLVQGIRKTDAQLRGRQTRELLTEIEADLSDAFAARDSFRARDAARRWNALIDREKIPADDPIRQRIAPIFHWLRDEDRRQQDDHAHEAAIQDLIHAIDAPGRVGPAALERLGNEVLRYERGMPDAIRQQFLTRLTMERDYASKRSRRTITASVVTASVVMGSGYFLYQRQSRFGDADRAATALADMVELGEIENATDFVKKLNATDPGLLAFPALVEAQAKFQAVQKKEVDRQLKFDAAMREAEHADLALAAPPSIETARGLARLETEKKGIEQLAKRRAAGAVAELARRDQDLAPKLDAINRRLGTIQELLGRSPFEAAVQRQAADQIAGSLAELNALAGDVRQAGPDSQSRSKAMASRLEAARVRLEHRRDLWRIEAEITAALAPAAIGGAGALNRFASLLADYAKKFPDEPRGKAFASTVAEKPIWDAVAAWCALATPWRGGVEGLTGANAKERAQACAGFLKKYPNDPGAASAADYQAYLGALAQRSTAENSPRKQLVELLSTLLVDDVWTVQYKDPKVSTLQQYYLSRPYDADANLLSYLVGFDGKERTRFIVKEFVASHDLAPQAKIARKFKPMLAAKAPASTWDTVTVDLMSTVRGDPDIDPLLKVALLRKICDYAGAGSFPLSRVLAPVRTILTQSAVDVNVPWMDPGNTDAARLRPKAESLVAGLPDFVEIGRQAKALTAEIEAYPARVPRSVGWLQWDESSLWQVRSPRPIAEEVDLWVAVPKGLREAAWKKAGEVRNGQARVRAEDRSYLAEGRPVFIIPGLSERKS